MRVLVCSPGYGLKFRRLFYGFDKVFLNGLVRSGHQVRHFADRDTADGFLFGWRWAGKGAVQRQLRRTAADFEPDILILLQADLVDPATVAALRRRHPAMKMALVDSDYPLSPKQRLRHARYGPHCDAAFLTCAGGPLQSVAEHYRQAFFVPNPADPGIMDPAPYAEGGKPHDLFFAARDGARFKIVNQLKNRFPDLDILRRGGDGSAVFGRPFERLMCSAKAGLNVSIAETDFYSSDRIALLFGFGLCACIAESTGYRRFLPADGAIYYRDAEDLGRQLTEALGSGAWEEIAARGRAAYLATFDSGRVASYVIDRLTEAPCDRYPWADLTAA